MTYEKRRNGDLMHGQLRFRERPPRSLPVGKIVQVNPGTPQGYWILSPRHVGVVTHFIDRRTMPCTATQIDGSDCHVDHAQTSCRWQGWLAVQKQGMPEAWFLSLTAAAYRRCLDLQDGSDLRGKYIKVGRIGERRLSQMYCKIGGYAGQEPRHQLMADPGVVDFLRNLWGIGPAFPLVEAPEPAVEGGDV